MQRQERAHSPGEQHTALFPAVLEQMLAWLLTKHHLHLAGEGNEVQAGQAGSLHPVVPSS